MRAKQFGLLILAVSLAASGASCVPCKHPLSDEKTSKIDERLIGSWRFYDGDKPNEDAGPLFVGKLKGSDTTLESVQCDVDKNGHVIVERIPLYATKVGSLQLISMPRQEVKEDQETVYDIALYEMPDKDTVNWYIMDEQALVAVIKKKELTGTVKADRTVFGAYRQAATITASSDELRKYIEKTGKKCFSTELATTMKRVQANP